MGVYSQCEYFVTVLVFCFVLQFCVFSSLSSLISPVLCVPPLYVSPHALVSSCFSIIYLFISSCFTLFFPMS